MALFESYERRIDKINEVLNSYGIASLEEAEKITKDAGLDVYNQIKGIQPICFENACWAYITGAAIAIKKGCTRAADAAAAIGEGLQAFCIPGSVADQRKVGLGHGNLGKMLLEETTDCFCFLAGHESFAAAEGAIGIAEKANKVRKKPLRVILNGLGKDAAQIISRINGFTFVETEYDPYTNEVKEVSRKAYSEGLRAKVDEYMDKTQLQNALAEIFKVVSRANKYIDETAPWVLAKDEANKPRLAAVLYNLLEAIRITSALLSPFMPTTMPEVWKQIGAAEDDVTYENAGKFGVLPADVTVNKGAVLFPRIDTEKEIDELNKLIEAQMAKTQKAQEKIELAPEIAIDEFFKTELRSAKVKSCEKVKKSKKLLKLQLDDGMGGRQVVSGIAEHYKPEDLIGKTVILVANLKPAKLCGEESMGMICAADMPDGGIKVVFLDDDVPAGTKIR